MQLDSVPVELDNLTREIMRLEIEQEALKKEKDEISKKRKEEIATSLASLKEQEQKMRNDWESEKNIKLTINKKKEELEKARFELQQAENNYDLEKAARLQHGTIPSLEKELEKLQADSKNTILSDVVDDEAIAAIISKWTNIPIKKLVSGEKEKLLSLKDNLKKRVKVKTKLFL